MLADQLLKDSREIILELIRYIPARFGVKHNAEIHAEKIRAYLAEYAEPAAAANATEKVEEPVPLAPKPLDPREINRRDQLTISIARMVKDQFGIDTVPLLSIRELGMDGLDVVELTMGIEEELNMEFPDDFDEDQCLKMTFDDFVREVSKYIDPR